MPHVQVPPVRRRGGISAEPVSEEDATSYVKKVVSSINKTFSLFHTNDKKYTKLFFIPLLPCNDSKGGAQGLQNDGRSVKGNWQERFVCAS